MIEHDDIRYRGRPITELSRDELLAALRELAARDRATAAMYQEHMGVLGSLMGIPVIESDDLPSCEGVRFGKPLY